MSRVIELPRGAHLRVRVNRGKKTQLEMVPEGISHEALRAFCKPKVKRSFPHVHGLRLRRGKLIITLEGPNRRPPSLTVIDETIDRTVVLLSNPHEMHFRPRENSHRPRRRRASAVPRPQRQRPALLVSELSPASR